MTIEKLAAARETDDWKSRIGATRNSATGPSCLTAVTCSAPTWWIDAATLWKRYIQLTEAEWAFRITKDELEIRPIWHHKEDRVMAHILVCFLAYVLWKTLAGWMRGAGLGDAPRTLLEELAKIKSGDVVLPACTRDGIPKRDPPQVRHRAGRSPSRAAPPPRPSPTPPPPQVR